MANENFLGTGWSFPPNFNKATHSVDMVSNENDIKQSLRILFSTKLTERVLRSDFGCDLSPLLFENITVTLLTKIKINITTAIERYESRIKMTNLYFGTERITEGLIRIELEYKIKATNSRHNYVFPFYLEEGTHIQR
ncbi:MAG: GPW/gp25 family protein [Bacteroidetes bacterium]|jgi:phage baseplate assembly protein W|nr:GPW/gp25 family protein [Bacteroidota bacterium]MBK8143670.1 GPW/gp25 family protein [Bacteroidota bacterium]MBP6315998.1 GPW/gp25 family protein [Chitinophagaceae bacterium]